MPVCLFSRRFYSLFLTGIIVALAFYRSSYYNSHQQNCVFHSIRTKCSTFDGNCRFLFSRLIVYLVCMQNICFPFSEYNRIISSVFLFISINFGTKWDEQYGNVSTKTSDLWLNRFPIAHDEYSHSWNERHSVIMCNRIVGHTVNWNDLRKWSYWFKMMTSWFAWW